MQINSQCLHSIPASLQVPFRIKAEKSNKQAVFPQTLHLYSLRFEGNWDKGNSTLTCFFLDGSMPLNLKAPSALQFCEVQSFWHWMRQYSSWWSSVFDMLQNRPYISEFFQKVFICKQKSNLIGSPKQSGDANKNLFHSLSFWDSWVEKQKIVLSLEISFHVKWAHWGWKLMSLCINLVSLIFWNTMFYSIYSFTIRILSPPRRWVCELIFSSSSSPGTYAQFSKGTSRAWLLAIISTFLESLGLH